MPKFVITGASGGGKSSLTAALASEGYPTVQEVGRQIVTDQLALKGAALPWLDQPAFMDLLFARSIAAFDEAGEARQQAMFFDRSFLEAIAYGRLIGRAPPPDMLQAAKSRRFEKHVFVCPPWRDIFTPDGERQHDFDFAVRDYEANIAVYSAAGYALVEIPRASIQERVAFIKRALARFKDFQSSNPEEKR